MRGLGRAPWRNAPGRWPTRDPRGSPPPLHPRRTPLPLPVMRLPFAKMHGLGNDFVVLDARARGRVPDPELVRALADRRLGVGCDQVLVLEPPARSGSDVAVRIYNADGGAAGQCGNGMRCVARLVAEAAGAKRVVIEVGGRQVEARLEDGQVAVSMGEPVLEPARIPFRGPAGGLPVSVEVDGEPVEIAALSLGNPHAVLWVEALERAPVAGLGARLQAHEWFPEGANIGFARRRDAAAIGLRVLERGAGETPACGSGACAAVVAGRLRGWLGERVEVELAGGILRVDWSGAGHPVILRGPAEHVFDGEFLL